jgi:hypothetical protein
MIESGDGLSFKGWRDKLFFWGITTVLVMSAGWAIHITQAIRERPTDAEIRIMIQSDQRLVDAQLSQLRQISERSSMAHDKNTEAINALRIELTRLTVKLDTISRN